MTCYELIEWAGFKQGRPTDREDAVFYKQIRGPNCNCNEKAPSLGLKVYEPMFDSGYSFEFHLYGELKSGTWLHLNLYSIKEEQLQNLNYYIGVAEAVWLAAYSHA